MYICRLYSRPTATYESASTQEFYHGRTDTIRSCTNEALAFVKTMVNPVASVSICTDYSQPSLGHVLIMVGMITVCVSFLTVGREETEYGGGHQGTQ